MLNGDISNAMPPRVLVTTDVITDTYEDKKKLLKLIPVTEQRVEYNRMVLSHLYVVSTKRGWTFELISFKLTEEKMSELMLTLDKVGTNPFRYGSVFKSVDELVTQLPYRPEIVGVIDKPDRLLRYGRWGLDFPNL
jgi:hypothetical protein